MLSELVSLLITFILEGVTLSMVCVLFAIFNRILLYNWLIWRVLKLAFFLKGIFPVFILASGAVRTTPSLCRHTFMRSLIWRWWTFAKKRKIKNHAKLTSYTVFAIISNWYWYITFLEWTTHEEGFTAFTLPGVLGSSLLPRDCPHGRVHWGIAHRPPSPVAYIHTRINYPLHLF